MNIKSIIYVFCLLCLFNIVHAKSLFYQPLLQDETLSQKQWDEQLSLAHKHGFSSIVIQWTKYGDVDFLQSAILQNVFNSPYANKFSFWLGLYLPTQYYSCFESDKIEENCNHTHIVNQQIARVENLILLANEKNIEISGLYLPTELTNKYMQNREVQLMLESITSWSLSIDVPLAISYFYGYQNTLTKSHEDISYLMNSGYEVFLQKGNGLNDTENIDDLIRLMPCTVHLVHEAFIETDESTLKPTDEAILHETCHHFSVFSLRYLPFSKLELIDGSITQ